MVQYKFRETLHDLYAFNSTQTIPPLQQLLIPGRFLGDSILFKVKTLQFV